MNINKFTRNSIEAINNCQKLANEYGNPQIDCEHLLYCLMDLDDSLIAKLIQRMDIDPDDFRNSIINLIQKKPKVQGGQQNISVALNDVLINAEDEAKAMGDEYIAVEHLFLCMMKKGSKEVKELFKSYGITR